MSIPQKRTLRQRNGYGFLVNRCNRCGDKLDDHNRHYSGKSPVCPSCATALKQKISFGIKGRNRKEFLVKHRQEYYEMALDKLINGKADVKYVEERWNKMKQVRSLRR